jgi:hypothetical protein
MRSFSAAVAIRAPKERIWPILTDAESYPEWNPVVERVDGSIEPGAQLRVFTKADPKRGFPVVVEQFAPPNKMVWRGAFPLNALVGTRTFLLRQMKDGSVEFEMREVYTGWLVGWLKKLLPDLQGDFERFAVALKRRAEASAAVESPDQHDTPDGV